MKIQGPKFPAWRVTRTRTKVEFLGDDFDILVLLLSSYWKFISRKGPLERKRRTRYTFSSDLLTDLGDPSLCSPLEYRHPILRQNRLWVHQGTDTERT